VTIRHSCSPPVPRRRTPARPDWMPLIAWILLFTAGMSAVVSAGAVSSIAAGAADPQMGKTTNKSAIIPAAIPAAIPATIPAIIPATIPAIIPAIIPAAAATEKSSGQHEATTPAERPLPPEKEFMAAVIQKVLDWEKNPPRPDYREHRVTTDFDGEDVSDKLDEVYRITWYRKKPVYILDKKNGAALPESSLEAQEDRKKRQIDDEIANPPTKEKIDAIYLTPLLDRYSYKIVARETLDGRSAIKIRFDPIPGKFPERKIASRILENITGFAWVDEESKELMKAEVTNPDTIHIGWGIVATVSYLRIDYERKPHPDLGFWFVSSLRVRAKVRIMLFKTYNRLSESTFFDLSMP
jgi:hypothetical protein